MSTIFSAVGSLFSKPKAPTQIIREVPSADTAEVKAAAQSEAERLRRRRGARSTIMTGPQGVTQAPTTVRTTLG